MGNISKPLHWGLVLAVCFCLLFQLTAGAAVSFTDIDGHWAKQQILQLQGEGYIKGYSDNTFRPDQPMSRAGFITVLINCLGGTATEDNQGNSFSDLQNHWSLAAVNRAVKLGIIVTSEYPNGFAPDNPIKRSEAAAMLVRALGQKPDNENVTFKDAAEVNKSIYKGYIKEAVDLGLISGYNDGYFRPFSSITRAQACVLMVRFLQYQGKTLPPENTAAQKTSPDTGTVLPRNYSFLYGNTMLQAGTEGVQFYASDDLISFDDITGIDPTQIVWNNQNYKLIGSRIRLNNIDYTVTETLWRGSTGWLEFYLSRD